MVDEAGIRTTLGENMGTINATNLKTAHAAIESGRTKGKIVLTGFCWRSNGLHDTEMRV